jgi:NTP pyrophosphatase (non-canonical NTP hydrolase)
VRINDFVKDAHEMAKEKGWWSPPKTPAEVHMLIVTEVAEATEAVRTDGVVWSGFKEPMGYYGMAKPEGEAVELVDAVIRIADYFGYMGWDMEKIIEAKMAYNKTRPHRHGDKKL